MRTGESLRAALEEIARWGWSYSADKHPAPPWQIEVNGDMWAGSTDGRILVVVPRECVSGECHEMPEHVANLARKWIPTAARCPTCIPARALKAFANLDYTPQSCETCKNSRRVECTTCDGDGGDECECTSCGDLHDCDCATCKGEGDVKCPDCTLDDADRPAQLLTGVVNRDKLADALRAVLPDDDVDIAVSLETCGAYLLRPVSGPQWLALVMKMADYMKPRAFFDQPETWTKQPAVSGR